MRRPKVWLAKGRRALRACYRGLYLRLQQNRGRKPERPCIGIREVREAELKLILGKDSEVEADEISLWGLSLSGGGIRSATFSLGVLQGLARLNLLQCFHYQSTVSGGGYIGAFLQAMIERRGFDEALRVLRERLCNQSVDGETSDTGNTRCDPLGPIRHLRKYSNYLSPRKSLISGDTMGMVSTYLRNVFLIQVQLCALLLGVSLLPYLIYRVLASIPSRLAIYMPIAVILYILAAFLLARIATSLHQYFYRDESGIARQVRRPDMKWKSSAVVALLASASVIAAVGLAHLSRLQGVGNLPVVTSHLSFFTPADLQLGITVACVYCAVWLPWFGFELVLSRQATGRNEVNWSSPLFVHWRRFLMGTLIASLFSGLAAISLCRAFSAWLPEDGWLWNIIIFGPSVVLIVLMMIGAVHVGLAGPALNELQREVWARIGGKATIAIVIGLGVGVGLVIYGPWLLIGVVHAVGKKWIELSGWGFLGLWFLTSGAGLLAAYNHRQGSSPARFQIMDQLARLAPWVFVLGLLVGISLGGQALLESVEWTRKDYDPTGPVAGYLDYLGTGANEAPLKILAVVSVSAVLWVMFGWMININDFSLNAFYSNRLVRCYLGASNERRDPEPLTDFDPRDDLSLADVVATERLNGRRPLFPLIGATLNLVGARHLEWQDRKGASFCLSPGYCGYLAPPSHPDTPSIGDAHAFVGATAPDEDQTQSLAKSLMLGNAIAISGAAVSPNMGYHSSPAVTFLLTLFDARLGWWLPNPSHPNRPSPDRAPFSGAWLLAEMFGRTHDGSEFVHLSDGGHFENLALYELVRRGCRFILCVDASADPDYAFEDLGNAVQKCRVDFGADISINVDAMRPGVDGKASSSCAVGHIRYPTGQAGVLLYLKPVLTGGEPTDIQHYQRTHASFPNESTSDQYFDEAQFESYRRLGEYVASRALESVLERAGVNDFGLRRDVPDLRDSDMKERVLIELEQVWTPRLPEHRERSASHRMAMSRLFTKLRDRPALSVLDAQMYPAWVDLVEAEASGDSHKPETSHSRRTRMPRNADFRECFYFCQELMQLMETVYHDLELENSWDHPDNRGWINAFKQWSWTPMFRIAWIMGAPTCGGRFVTFCETRLEMPRLNKALRLDELKRHNLIDWKAYCDALASDGLVNHVEHQMLLSEAIVKDSDDLPRRVFLLRLKWRSVLSRTPQTVPSTTLGIAVLSGATLRVLRVQDHLRGLGLGSEFLRRIVSIADVTGVDIRPGHYGVVGACSRRRAKAYEERLKERLLAVQRHLRSLNAVSRDERIASGVEPGSIYEGRVVKIMSSGALVNILPGRDGFVHITQISKERVEGGGDMLRKGDAIRVRVLKIDKQGRIRLSMKAVEEGEGVVAE